MEGILSGGIMSVNGDFVPDSYYSGCTPIEAYVASDAAVLAQTRRDELSC